MLKFFNKYVNQYDVGHEKIMSKVEHSIRVYEKMIEYAKKLGYSEEEIKIAGEIGLLHDIGRFAQHEKTGSYDDIATFDHAEYGVYILFEKDIIKEFDINPEHFKTIRYAIKYHNKLKLHDCKDAKIMKLAKLIRDVDKIDIIYLLGALGQYNEKADNSAISPKIYECIQNHKSIDKHDILTNNDKLALRFALAFDINNDMCIKEFKKNLIEYYNRIEKDDKFRDIFDITIKYLDERMKSKC